MWVDVLLMCFAAVTPPAFLVYGIRQEHRRKKWVLRDEQARLLSPVLNGVPLPAVDDPRWRVSPHYSRALGFFTGGRSDDLYIYDSGNIYANPGPKKPPLSIGNWTAYRDAVHTQIATRLVLAAIDSRPQLEEEKMNDSNVLELKQKKSG